MVRGTAKLIPYAVRTNSKRQYAADQRNASPSTVFSVLAMIIEGLGIFGLVAAATEQRTKELGIRRTLGARPKHLFLLLLKDDGVTIGLSFLSHYRQEVG